MIETLWSKLRVHVLAAGLLVGATGCVVTPPGSDAGIGGGGGTAIGGGSAAGGGSAVGGGTAAGGGTGGGGGGTSTGGGTGGGGGSASDAGDAFPRLGVYVVNVDGGNLRLLLDAGTRELSHVRRLPGSPWLTATQYAQDPDHNGLALEDEANLGAFYTGTQIVVFSMDPPSTLTVVAGETDAGIAANPSWTQDGRLIHLAIDAGASPTTAHFDRLSFSTLPVVSSVETLAVPSVYVAPVDPHQFGPSNATGFITFTALFNLSAQWLSPVWRMPASGTSVVTDVSFVGCPICVSQGGCCGFATPAEVLGTNDSRINHAGTAVMWMQQEPDVYFDFGQPPVRVHPQRQAMRGFDAGVQLELQAAGVPSTALLSYGEWRSDDQEVVYWRFDLLPNPTESLELMNPDGTNRRRIPLPPQLCARHPSYLSDTEIVFNARRCGGAACSCGVDTL